MSMEKRIKVFWAELLFRFNEFEDSVYLLRRKENEEETFAIFKLVVIPQKWSNRPSKCALGFIKPTSRAIRFHLIWIDVLFVWYGWMKWE